MNKILIGLIFSCFLFIACKDKEKSTAKFGFGFHSKSEFKTTNLAQQLNANLIFFLENPIDLTAFKQKKGKSLSSVANGLDYYFNPKTKDSIYYAYSTFPNDSAWQDIAPLKMTVFKSGKRKHQWNDSHEIIVDLEVWGKDVDLVNANLVGLTKSDIVSKLGSDYFMVEQEMIYSHSNKVLILDFADEKVQSYRYVKLNTEKIDERLIRRMRK